LYRCSYTTNERIRAVSASTGEACTVLWIVIGFPS
jgi:hypothetical protein